MNGVTRGDPVRTAQAHDGRIGALERRSPNNPSAQRPKPVRGESLGPWGSVASSVSVGTGAEDEVRWGGKSLDVVVRLTAAVTGATTVAVYVNGVLEDSVTVASGGTAARKTLAVRTSPGDAVRCDVTAAGTGASKLSVRAWVNA